VCASPFCVLVSFVERLSFCSLFPGRGGMGTGNGCALVAFSKWNFLPVRAHSFFWCFTFFLPLKTKKKRDARELYLPNRPAARLGTAFMMHRVAE